MNAMRMPRRNLLLGGTGAALLLMGCAPLRPPGPRPPDLWSGRLSLSVRSEPAQSFSAGFELSGRPEAGELLLSTPLGTTLAQARWSPGQALLV
jgi:outer membrane lipoprotein LolB